MTLVTHIVAPARAVDFVVILDFSLRLLDEIKCIFLRQYYTNATSLDTIRFELILGIFCFGLRMLETL